MKHELLILISTLPCCLLFANVGIQLPKGFQPNVHESPTEPTKERSSKPQPDNVHDEHTFFRVPIQIKHPTESQRSSFDQSRNAGEERKQNTTYHDIHLPLSYSADQKKLHDIIYENSKKGFHSGEPKCELTEGKKCDERKKINDVDLSKEVVDKAELEENFKHPSIVNVNSANKFSSQNSYHNNSATEISHRPSNSTNNHPLPAAEFPYNKGKPVDTAPTPTDEHPLPAAEFPFGSSKPVDRDPTSTNEHPLPPEEFPYGSSKPVDRDPTDVHLLPAAEFPFNGSKPVDTPPNPADVHPLPAEEFPFNSSKPVNTPPSRFYPLPATKTHDSYTPEPTKPTSSQSPSSNGEDGKQSYHYSQKDIVIMVLGFSLFGAFCYILYDVYVGRLQSCRRRHRQMLVEEFDEEDGTRMEMNPRNNEENSPL